MIVGHLFGLLIFFSEHQIANLVGVDPRLRQHAAEFPTVNVEVVGPFDSGLDATEIGHEVAQIGAHPEGEGGHATGLELGPEDEARVDVAAVLAVPDAAEPAATKRLPAGQHDKRRGPPARQLAFGLVVSTIHLSEAEQVERSAPQFQMRQHKQGVDARGVPADAVAAAAHSLELEPLRAQLLHVHPDADPAHAQLPGQGSARDEIRITGEQFAEDGGFGGGHGREPSDGPDAVAGFAGAFPRTAQACEIKIVPSQALAESFDGGGSRGGRHEEGSRRGGVESKNQRGRVRQMSFNTNVP